MSATEFELERIGDAYGYVWHEYGYAIAFDQLRQERYGLVGEIHVKTSSALASTGRPGHMFAGIFNLSKLDERDKLAKALGEKNAQAPWTDLLEVARTETMTNFRAGEPMVWLRDVRIQPQMYLIDRMLPVGETSVFFGDGSSTKSLIGAAMAVAVATGRPVGPFRPKEQAPVLVLDFETTEEEWAERVWRLCQGMGLESYPEGLAYQRQQIPVAAARDAIQQRINQSSARFLVIDSIAQACGGEVTADNVVPLFNVLRSFHGTTRYLVSHISKATAGQDHGPGDPYGAVFVKNFGRSVWAVKREEAGEGTTFEVSLVHRKVNRGPLQKPIGLAWTFEDPSGPITLSEVDAMENPSLAQHGSISDRVVAVLKRGALDSKDLAAEVGVSPRVLSVVGNRMTRSGRIVRLDDHRAGGRSLSARYGLPAAE